MKKVWVDFNGADGSSIDTLAEFCDDELRDGDLVLTYDHDGNTCEATVLWQAGSVVRLRLHQGTFIPGGGDRTCPTCLTRLRNGDEPTCAMCAGEVVALAERMLDEDAS